MTMTELQVLVLDDDPTVRDMTAAMLEELGVASIVTAADGREGLQLLDAALPPPNILICDLTMPGMDGIEFLRHVAARRYRGDVVLLSGVTAGVLKAAERLAAAHDLDVLGVMEKPVELDRLAEVLSRGRRGGKRRAARADLPALSVLELRDGIGNGCVELHYQPKVSLRTGQVAGAECLARWRHAVHGLLPPSAFVETIEQNHLIDAFTVEVFRLAVAQQRVWLDLGISLKVSVNLSMNNLLRVDLPEILLAMTEAAGVSPQGIVLELTESRLVSDLRLSLEVLIRLRLMGFGLSIDDFGTGFSSMEVLKQLPFSELKIDRAFVNGADADPAARAILKSSANLGATLGMNVVAEGVETQSDWNAVADVGCDEVQGYFVARPLAADALRDWLAKREAAGVRAGSLSPTSALSPARP
ncbi:EAL domain-containing response regulator [Aromatoleum toluclasticum]|uniref:EAL domain-containing response regulator n=1 Tax=Aromatoleum toluclasticum TaxID=92003 RepID=UPI001D190CF8|nr:EAL domain-containing response regulator [Aromatoleum toluclasticum]